VHSNSVDVLIATPLSEPRFEYAKVLPDIANGLVADISETRIPVNCKLEQMKAVINDLARYPKDMPAVVLGDLNTWELDAVSRTFKLFTAEGFQTPFGDESTFFHRALFISIDLKLDWIWLRNLEPTTHGIDRAIKLSDHWPLWIVLRRPGSEVTYAKVPPTR